MEEFLKAFTTYKGSYYSYEEYRIFIVKKRETAGDTTDFEEEKYNSLLKAYLTARSKAENLLIDYVTQAKLAYGDVLAKLFVKTVKENNWDDLYLMLQISGYKVIQNDIAEEIAWCITMILDRDEIGVWSRGAIIESLLKLFNPRYMDKQVILQTAQKVIASFDEDEAYHALREAQDWINYLNK